MSLEFKDTQEAQALFSGLRGLAETKRVAIMLKAQQEGIIVEHSKGEEDKKRKGVKEEFQKNMRNLAVIE